MADQVRPGTFGMWLLLGLAVGAPLVASLWSAAHVDAPAPGFALRSTGYEDGVQGQPLNFTLADYHGKTVVLDLMARSCTSCRYVTADVLRPLWQRYGNDTDFAILSIDAWADPAAVEGFAGETTADVLAVQKESGVPWRHALDTDHVWRKYSVTGLPRVIVVTPTGQLAYDYAGEPALGDVDGAVRASMVGSAIPVPLLRLSLGGLAFVAGAASVLTPCSAGMIPAYLGMLLEEVRAAPPAVRIRRSLLGGLSAAAGIVILYALLGILFTLAGAPLRATIPYLGPAVGIALVAFGIMAMLGRGVPGLGRASRAVDGRRGFFVFGLAFALAGFGCTAPLFLPLLLAGFFESTATGILLFVLYATAVALVVVLIAAIVAEGAMTKARRLLEWTPAIQRLAGLLMAGAGVYLAYYFLAAPR
ncbi:MAG: cytochrome c biogenesis protein CcdA [bacterium]